MKAQLNATHESESLFYCYALAQRLLRRTYSHVQYYAVSGTWKDSIVRLAMELMPTLTAYRSRIIVRTIRAISRAMCSGMSMIRANTKQYTMLSLIHI